MTEIQYDESLIGPLSPDHIGDEPQSWGERRSFSVTDVDAEREVEREVRRKSESARVVLSDQLRSLLLEVRDQVEPRSILHGLLVWGPITAPALAGFLSFTVTEVESCLKALSMLSIAIPTGRRDDMDDSEYVLAPDAINLERIFGM